jgi:sulfur relay (sulfurtransferase) complex TusBCD TusD component (DsrE family)
MRLAILLTASYGAEDRRTALKIAHAALDQGHVVSLFLMDDGVFNAAEAADLIGENCEVVLCSYSATQRGLAKDERVLFGGQHDWARMVSQADRVISFD